MDLAQELQRIYASEINVEIGWIWDGGIEIRLGDRMNGFVAESTVKTAIEITPWLQEAIAHFYPNSTYARSLDNDLRDRATRRLFPAPRVGAKALCPHCGAPYASPALNEVFAFNCHRCGKFVKVQSEKGRCPVDRRN